MKYLLVIMCLMTACSSISTSPTKLPDADILAAILEDSVCSTSTDASEMVGQITKRFKINPALAAQVVKYSHEYANQTFPTAKDIVAIIGVESSFRTQAVSNLRHDPAIGLTQIRPGAWSHKIKRHELNSVENQVKYGAYILRHYYKVLGDRNNAVMAYNVGLAGFQKGYTNTRYVQKYKKELAQYL